MLSRETVVNDLMDQFATRRRPALEASIRNGARGIVAFSPTRPKMRVAVAERARRDYAAVA